MLVYFCCDGSYDPMTDGRMAKAPKDNKRLYSFYNNGSQKGFKSQYFSCSHSLKALIKWAIKEDSSVWMFNTDNIPEGSADWIDVYSMADEELADLFEKEIENKGFKKVVSYIRKSEEITFTGKIPAGIIKPVFAEPSKIESRNNDFYWFMQYYGKGSNGGCPGMGLVYYTKAMKEGGMKAFGSLYRHVMNYGCKEEDIASLREMWLILRDKMQCLNKKGEIPKRYME